MVFGRAARAISIRSSKRGKERRVGGSRPPSVYLPSAAYCILPTAFCLLLSAFCPLPSAAGQNPSGPASQIDPKAQGALDQAIQALGGQAFLRAKSLTTRGRIFAIEEGQTAGFAPFRSTVEYPEKRRFSYGKDKPVILVNDGERGWELDRYGIIRQSPARIRRWRLANRYSLENLLRRVIHEPGTLIQDGGVDFVANVSVRVVDIVDAQRIEVKLYLNKVKSLPVRITYRIQNPETREWDEFADVYGEYRTFQGIQTPMRITRLLNGERVSELYRNTAEYDASYPSNLFAPVP